MTQAMKKIAVLGFALMMMMATTAMAGELNLSVAASLKEVINDLTGKLYGKTFRHCFSEKLRSFGYTCRSDRKRRACRPDYFCKHRMGGLPEQQKTRRCFKHQDVYL